VEVTFTTPANPTVNTGSGTGTFTEDESEYTLAINPFVADVADFGNNLIYYQYVLADNHFPKTALEDLKPIKPFEALVIYSGAGTPNRVVGQGLDETDIPSLGKTEYLDDEVVATYYYDLVGTAHTKPIRKGGVYIEKTVYKSGKTRIEKKIIL
jgi:hypothetical protein